MFPNFNLEACLAVGPVRPIDDGVLGVKVSAVDHVLLCSLALDIVTELAWRENTNNQQNWPE